MENKKAAKTPEAPTLWLNLRLKLPRERHVALRVAAARQSTTMGGIVRTFLMSLPSCEQ